MINVYIYIINSFQDGWVTIMNKKCIKRIDPESDEAIDRLLRNALGGLVVLKTPYGYYFLRAKKEITRENHRLMKHAS